MKLYAIVATLLVLASLHLLQSSDASTTQDERVALTMTSEDEVKIFVHGLYSGAVGSGVRGLLDGDAVPLMDATGITGPANRSAYSNEVRKICSSVKCGDGQLVKGDLLAFSRLVESSGTMFELLSDSGIVNATVTMNDVGPQSTVLVAFYLTTEEGNVKAVLPVESDYNLNLRFSSKQSSDIISFSFRGRQGERSVPFSFTAMLGWEVSAKDGLKSQSIRSDYPESGYVTMEGVMSSPNTPARVATSPKQVDPVCISVIVIAIILSVLGMYLAWKRMKKQRVKEAKIRAKEKKEVAESGDERAKEGGRDRTRLKELRDRGIITDPEYEQKVTELDAKN